MEKMQGALCVSSITCETARTLTPTEEVCWKILGSGLSALQVPPRTVTLGELFNLSLLIYKMGIISILQESYKEYMYVCKYIYNKCIYMWVYIHTYMTSTQLFMCMYVYKHMHVCMYVYVYMCVSTCDVYTWWALRRC